MDVKCFFWGRMALFTATLPDGPSISIRSSSSSIYFHYDNAMNTNTFVLAFIIIASNATAQTRTSANYSLTPDTLDSGGGRITSSDYSMATSIGLVVGVASGGAPTAQEKVGYIAQLVDPASLQLSAAPSSVNEGGASQLSATVVMDDATTTPLLATAVTWSVQSGPITGVSSAGVATAGVVYQNTGGAVQGGYAGLTGSANLTVINTNNDNFGFYAGDGIDDAWQVQYFGLNNPKALAGMDPDGDGQNNLFEYIAGTVPSDSTSRFLLRIENVPGQLFQKRLNFSPIVAGRTYTPRTSLTLGTGALWMDLSSSSFQDVGAERTVTDLNAAAVSQFYHVEISKP